MLVCAVVVGGWEGGRVGSEGVVKAGYCNEGRD
jgi:hypothetical protein